MEVCNVHPHECRGACLPLGELAVFGGSLWYIYHHYLYTVYRPVRGHLQFVCHTHTVCSAKPSRYIMMMIITCI